MHRAPGRADDGAIMTRRLNRWAWIAGASLWMGACSFDPPPMRELPDAPDLGERDQRASQDGAQTLPDQAQDQAQDRDQAQGIDQGIDQDIDQDIDQGVLGPDAQMTLDMASPDQSVDLGQPSLRECGGAMVDVSQSVAHCGRCDSSCDAAWGVCAQGRCGCAQGLSACGPERLCYDTRVDPNHCGQCDFKCGPGAVCQQGRCQCRPGFTECSGVCVDMRVDPAHCGQCGRSCAGKACRNSQCRRDDSCDLGDGVCRSAQGVACLKFDSFENDLYCRHGADYGCGQVCGGDQRCMKPDLLRPRACVAYRPARGCLSCPCADCGRDEQCREETLGTTRRAYCFKP